jgi:dolichol-phosphate mannosyltransferase
MENLAVIMPIYNEEDIIETVINEWILELDKLEIDYKFFAYNDGSTDKTSEILRKIADANSNLIVINQQNCWHGPTILKGYKDNAPNFSWIFQVDADREMKAEEFGKMWEKRSNYDFLMVIRKNRPQNLSRKIISLISRLCIWGFYGKGPWDVNSQYRLMRSEKFLEIFKKLSADTLSPNMILSGFVAKKKLKFYEHPVVCMQRQTGEALNKMKLIKTAIKSFWQTIIFSFAIK